MGDNNKKRAGSFRKLFPNLFFSHKSKEKNSNKEAQGSVKGASELPKGNQYHNPRTIISDKHAQGSDDSERIYENLSTHGPQSDNETQSNDISSHHSSSSTLVSDSAKTKSVDMKEPSEVKSLASTNYAARPQVPPKPYDTGHSPQSPNRNNQLNSSTPYPDVYYHSLEKLSDTISPLDEIEIYRASQAQVNPASVGAEIKRVSTKFLISPKKEAEVRTIQPTRARSLSFDGNKDDEKEKKVNTRSSTKEDYVKKPYNYSAPTSPMPISHKMPNMPKTVSPYEHVRKAMIENEEKRNSLSRTSIRNKSTPSPRPEYGQRFRTTPSLQENAKLDSLDREKTRQKVEAFYWQKLKELKQKEDEYLIRQSLNSSLKSPARVKTNSNCSSPNSFSFVMEPRSCSLPRGNDFKSYSMNQPIYTTTPFVRGAPERRTDTYIKSRTSAEDPEIIYRHPEKIYVRTSPRMQEKKMPIYQRGSATLESRAVGQMKRVSFEEQYVKSDSGVKSDSELKVEGYKIQNRMKGCPSSAVKVCETQSRVPPRPPIRTTSVGGVGKNIKLENSKKSVHLAGVGHSICSESESGSEAGEIQRILQSNSQKGKRIDFLHF